MGRLTRPTATGRCSRVVWVTCGLLLVAAAPLSASPLRIRTDYSPENSQRPLRPQTRYIVLHTTEGREVGSLRKLRRRGEAHYFVHRDGRATRLIDRRRIATHAGLSMWNGRRDLDEVSLGVEVSGYHNQEPTPAQYVALRELIRQLQSLYDLPDERVLTHSMVAYGEPNRFHAHAHRGRKRCAMVFARPDVRRQLGLTAAPRRDPDVVAGRLRPADRELQRALYPRPARPVPIVKEEQATALAEVITSETTAWSIAGEAHRSPTTVYVFPDGARVTGDAVKDWSAIPPGTRVLLERTDAGKSGDVSCAPPHRATEGLLLVAHPTAACELLGNAATADTTTYLLPSGSVLSGADLLRGPDGRDLLRSLPAGTKVLVGYVNGGKVARGQDLIQTAGTRWNDPRTYYRTPNGRVRSGVEVDQRRLAPGTLVFLRQ